MSLIPLEDVTPPQSAVALHYQREAGKLSTVTLGLDDLVVVTHRYLGDNFGVHIANVGAHGPVEDESDARPVGLFNAGQVKAFARRMQLVPSRGELAQTFDWVRFSCAPLEWQTERAWRSLRDRILLARPQWPGRNHGAAVGAWLFRELEVFPDAR